MRMSPSFRVGLAALGMRYVLNIPAVPRSGPWNPHEPVRIIEVRPSTQPQDGDGQREAMEQRIDVSPEGACHEITVAEGPQEPRTYRFSAQRMLGTKGTQGWRGVMGHLAMSLVRQRIPLLPVQRPSGRSNCR